MIKMSEILEFRDVQEVHLTGQTMAVRVWVDGAVDIKVYTVPKEALENISKITGKEIKEHGDSRWVAFPRARDKSSVTLFQE